MNRSNISRRKFVSGTAAIAATGVTASLFASSAVKAAVPATKGIASGPYGPVDLAKYHCSLVHKAMSDKLTRIVADPNISSADTAQALKTTFCPCCSTQINASYPVVPWQELGKAYG